MQTPRLEESGLAMKDTKTADRQTDRETNEAMEACIHLAMARTPSYARDYGLSAKPHHYNLHPSFDDTLLLRTTIVILVNQNPRGTLTPCTPYVNAPYFVILTPLGK